MNPIISSRQPTSMQDYMRDNPFTRQARLEASLPFRQAGPEGQRRMSENVQKGLPPDIDPQRIFVSGYTAGYTPIYSAVLGASGGFGGGWGSIGMDREPKSTGKLKAGAPLGSAGSSGYDLAKRMRGGGGPQPAAGVATDIAKGQAPTLTDTPSPYSGFGFGSPNLGMGNYTPPTTEQTPKFGLGGSSLTSPLAGPSPSISFPTKEEEILNPYGLRNY
jgi:hypothetical protein